MKRFISIISMMILSSSLWAQPDCTPVETLSGTIINKTLDASILYRVSGDVNITGNFVVPKGTVITFDTGDNLYFVNGSYPEIEGTELEPVIFTSIEAPGFRVPKPNAGVYFSGDGLLNEGSLLLPNGNTHVSGNNPNHNSGHFEHVRFEFLSGHPDLGSMRNMDNGVTFMGMGNQTFFKNVQVSNSANNGIAIFGGAADMEQLFLLDNYKNNMLIAYGNTSDISQILAINKDPLATHIAGTNGLMIWNNDFPGNVNELPLTEPIIRNSSFIGFKHCGLAEKGNGIIIDYNGGGHFVDNVVTGYATGLLIEDDVSPIRTSTGTLTTNYLSFANNNNSFGHGILPWSGCGGSMSDWIEGLGVASCIQEENQFGVSPLAYDASFCADFCGSGFSQNFVLNPASTRLDDPSSNSLLDYRGAIDATDRFTWIDICPQNFVACNLAPLPKMGQLEVYPNPATYSATVNFEVKSAQTVQVRVMEMVSGRILYSAPIQVQEGKQSLDIPTESWKEGVYNVQIQMNEELLHGKLSVK